MKPPTSCDVYTPAPLAKAMVASLGDDGKSMWLEPCVGKGAFLQALSSFGVNPDRVFGTDLNPTSEPSDRLATVCRGAEFLSWALKTENKFSRIVANPPYIALSNLPRRVQVAAAKHSDPTGVPVKKGGNCWNAFLCASLRLLERDGSLAFVLPAAFDYANYARSIREELPKLFREVAIHRCKTPLFEEVEDGSVVVIAKGYKEKATSNQRFIHRDLASLVHGLAKGVKKNNPRRSSEVLGHSDVVPFSQVMQISIGAVTGDAGYFLMDEPRRKELGLPIAAMVPALSKSHHVYSEAITLKRWRTLRDNGERIWLFRPDVTLLRRKSVNTYLSLSTEEGGCNREAYKVRNRSPWYTTPMPKAPHGFMTGMSQYGPAICLNRMKGLTATNTLYTVRFVDRPTLAERTRWAMMMITTCVQEQLSRICRHYALGLTKIEPGDLNSLQIPVPSSRCSSLRVYEKATNFLLSGDIDEATALADSWIR